jgi:biotin carboxyl carrier protein
MYRVEHDGGSDILYVAGTGSERWVFWSGHVLLVDPDISVPRSVRARPVSEPLALTSPMPARVLAVFVAPGAVVKKGDTIVLLEAMKMELPVRAPADSKVIAVHCREGDLVDADATLVDLI